MAFQQMVDAKQKQLIHIAKTQLGLSDVNYRTIIEAQTKGKKNSSKDLTYFEADAVINYFVKKLGFEIQSNYIRTSGAARRARWQKIYKPQRIGKTPTNLFILPSPDQLEMIDALVKKIAWRFEDGYDRWMKKYMKIDRIKTDDDACKVIEGLKGMLYNQDGEWDI